jgi:hypothetical protein
MIIYLALVIVLPMLLDILPFAFALQCAQHLANMCD